VRPLSRYLIGYLVIAIGILFVVNQFLLRKPKPAGDSLRVQEVMQPSHSPQGQFKTGQILFVLLLGAFVAILNQTLLNVAIPRIMNDLNISANTVQWLSTGYMLVNGVCIPLTAYLIEKFGTRKLFLVSMILFSTGAVVCATSPNFPLLMFGRVVQAAGAGIIMPLMMTVFLTIFPPEKRGAAMGTMGIAIIFAPAVGPTLSGWIVEHYSWRVLFDIVIPFGVVDLLFAILWMKNVTKMSNPKFDFLGAALSTLGFGGLLYGFSQAGSDGWSDPTVITWLIIGAIALAGFIGRELTTDRPMLELRVFKYNIFTLTTVISCISNMALFGGMLLLPIYLQNIRGFTPLESGLLLLPGSILMGIMSPIAGKLFDRFGARWLVVIGLTITTITTWQFSKLTGDTAYDTILLLYTLRCFGMSFIMMTIMTAGLNQLPLRLSSHGTAASNTARQVAASLGTAFLVTVMTSRQKIHLADFANTITTANPYLTSQFGILGKGIAHLAGMPTQNGNAMMTQLLYGMAAKQSAIEGINDAFLVATGLTMVALLLAFFIKRVTPENVSES
jgi:EmrB/QacA subfamily drug resistance transporter